MFDCSTFDNLKGTATVGVLASRSWVQANGIGICCFSAKQAALGSKNKDWLTPNQDNVSRVERQKKSCLPANCNYSKVALLNPTKWWSGTNQTSSTSHRDEIRSNHDIPVQLLTGSRNIKFWKYPETCISLLSEWRVISASLRQLSKDCYEMKYPLKAGCKANISYPIYYLPFSVL